MQTSESISKIAPALLKAQKAISYAIKSETNPFFKNRYADLPTVIDAVKPALNDAGIVFLQTPSPSEDGRLHLTTRFIHESGEWIEDTAVTTLSKQDPQGVGSAITYLRRYSLASFIGLYQDDDDGNAASNNHAQPQANKTIAKKQQEKTPSVEAVKQAIEKAKSHEELGRIEKKASEVFANHLELLADIRTAIKFKSQWIKADQGKENEA